MSKTTIYVLILSLITLLAWLGFELYHQSQQTTLPQPVQESLNPIDPSLNTQILDELQEKQVNQKGESLPF